jgi:hypothetical protein
MNSISYSTCSLLFYIYMMLVLEQSSASVNSSNLVNLNLCFDMIHFPIHYLYKIKYKLSSKYVLFIA